jgi:enoyl-CoA hydratase
MTLDYRPTPSIRTEELDDGRIVVVTLSRPEKRNAINDAMHDTFVDVWRAIGRSKTASAAVLLAEGKSFCAGGDRGQWGTAGEEAAHRQYKILRAAEPVLEMARCPVPIVAGVNGPAIGLGCSIVLASDLVLMTPEAYLQDNHINYGLVPGDGAGALLPFHIPLNRARELLLTGDRLPADEARDYGIVSRLVPGDRLAAECLALARRISANPQAAVRGAKRTWTAAMLGSLSYVSDMAVAYEALGVASS